MKILLLCDRYPYPLYNGQNLRIYHYARQLSQRHTFDMVCYADQPKPPSEIRGLFENITAFPRPRKTPRSAPKNLADAFSVGKMFAGSPETREFLAGNIPTKNYDLLWVSGWDMIVNLSRSPGAPILMDAVDDGVLEYWRELKNIVTPPKFVGNLKWLLMNALFERRYFAPADQCLFVSEVDAQFFRITCPRTPASVIHNGVDVEYYSPLGQEEDPFSLVFEGNLGFHPNTDAVLHFCRRIFPLVVSAVPQVKLTLVGKEPPPEILRCASEMPQNIEVTGFVQDVRPHVQRAAVFICPLKIGAGIKNKILQAWAMGKAVVATSASVGGLFAQDGANIEIRDSPSDFARTVLELLENPNRRRSLGAAGRKTVKEHYTWQQKALELEQLMTDLLKK